IGQRVIAVAGNSKLALDKIQGEKVQDFLSFGKQFLIQLETFTIRIHLLLFGTYRINERKETPARLSLVFGNGEINFYGCSVNFITNQLDGLYDWSADVM